MTQTTQTAQGSIWAHFDYDRMAEESRRERDALREIRKRRLAEGPGSPDQAMLWDQENRRFYEMYLDQRKNVMEFERRARKRRAYGA